MIRVELYPGGRVDLRGEVELPLRASAAWGQLRHFTHFVSLDPFHSPVRSDPPFACAGARLTIGHRFGFLRLERVGRILRWREGVGYSFSDLSSSGVRAGFPHVFTYALEPSPQQTGLARCHLRITVRGKWTAGWVPRWMVRWWLRWVMSRTLETVEMELLQIALATSRGDSV